MLICLCDVRVYPASRDHCLWQSLQDAVQGYQTAILDALLKSSKQGRSRVLLWVRLVCFECIAQRSLPVISPPALRRRQAEFGGSVATVK